MSIIAVDQITPRDSSRVRISPLTTNEPTRPSDAATKNYVDGMMGIGTVNVTDPITSSIGYGNVVTLSLSNTLSGTYNFTGTLNVENLVLPVDLPGTPTPLSYYEQWTSGTISLTSPWTTPQTCTISIVRLGNSVTVKFPEIKYYFNSALSHAPITGTVGSIPTRFCPVANTFLPFQVITAFVAGPPIDIYTLQSGQLEIYANGGFNVLVSPMDPFSGGEYVGWPTTSVTYMI